LAEDPAYAAQHATKQELAEAKKAAMIATDMESFYQQSQRAVRLAASVKAQKNLHTAGAAEVNQAAPNSAAEEIDELFKAADIHRFSKSESSGDLTNAKTSLGRILKAL
jgi:anti-sigma factor RsiW